MQTAAGVAVEVQGRRPQVSVLPEADQGQAGGQGQGEQVVGGKKTALPGVFDLDPELDDAGQIGYKGAKTAVELADMDFQLRLEYAEGRGVVGGKDLVEGVLMLAARKADGERLTGENAGVDAAVRLDDRVDVEMPRQDSDVPADGAGTVVKDGAGGLDKEEAGGQLEVYPGFIQGGFLQVVADDDGHGNRLAGAVAGWGDSAVGDAGVRLPCVLPAWRDVRGAAVDPLAGVVGV